MNDPVSDDSIFAKTYGILIDLNGSEQRCVALGLDIAENGICDF